MLRREITDVRLQVTEREEGKGKIGMLRNDEREYERDKTDGELERGWEGGRKQGGGEGSGGERSVLRASRPNPALPSHHANCTTVG